MKFENDYQEETQIVKKLHTDAPEGDLTNSNIKGAQQKENSYVYFKPATETKKVSLKRPRPKTSLSATNVRNTGRTNQSSVSNSPAYKNRTSMVELQKQINIHKKQFKRDKNIAHQIVDMCSQEQIEIGKNLNASLSRLEEQHMQDHDSLQKSYQTVKD